jgi:hypothetical protein
VGAGGAVSSSPFRFAQLCRGPLIEIDIISDPFAASGFAQSSRRVDSLTLVVEFLPLIRFRIIGLELAVRLRLGLSSPRPGIRAVRGLDADLVPALGSALGQSASGGSGELRNYDTRWPSARKAGWVAPAAPCRYRRHRHAGPTSRTTPSSATGALIHNHRLALSLHPGSVHAAGPAGPSQARDQATVDRVGCVGRDH